MLAPNVVLQNRYRVMRHLGQGGMGTVYEAFDQRLNSSVALKETLFQDERLRRQFEREAQLLARLRHPAMTRVIDHFTESDGQFLVMDYIEGEDLSEMLQKRGGAFDAQEVLSWADQLLDALDYLCAQTPPVVHRDIKPQNLKLTGRGRIILLDFGLAKGHAGQQTNITTTKSVLGYSLAYAPLEQLLQVEPHWVEMLSVSNAPEVQRILAGGTDARSDLYSLSATLVHLLTGKAPTNAPTRALSIWAGRTDPLLAGLRERAPSHVVAALARAMALSPDERFATPAEMRAALKDETESRTREATTPDEATKEAARKTLPPTIVDLPPTQHALREIRAEERVTSYARETEPAQSAPLVSPAQWAAEPARTIQAPFAPAPVLSLTPDPQTLIGTLKVPKYAYALAVGAGFALPLLFSLIIAVLMNSLRANIFIEFYLPIILFIFLHLAFGALGAIFGYKWPSTGWKWGLWLLTIPCILIMLAHIMIAPQRDRNPALVLLLEAPSLLVSCIAAGIAARYSPGKSERRPAQELARVVETPFAPAPALTPVPQQIPNDLLRVPIYAYPVAVLAGVVAYFFCIVLSMGLAGG